MCSHLPALRILALWQPQNSIFHMNSHANFWAVSAANVEAKETADPKNRYTADDSCQRGRQYQTVSLSAYKFI